MSALKQDITIAAAVIGRSQLLESIIKVINKRYPVFNTKYSKDSNGVSKVVFKVNVDYEYRELLEIVANDLNIKEKDIENWTKKPRKITFARGIIAFILHERYKYSFPKIALMMNSCSHCSPLQSSRQFKKEYMSTKVKNMSLICTYVHCKNQYLKNKDLKKKYIYIKMSKTKEQIETDLY